MMRSGRFIGFRTFKNRRPLRSSITMSLALGDVVSVTLFSTRISAVAQVCADYGVPFAAMRTITRRSGVIVIRVII